MVFEERFAAERRRSGGLLASCMPSPYARLPCRHAVHPTSKSSAIMEKCLALVGFLI